MTRWSEHATHNHPPSTPTVLLGASNPETGRMIQALRHRINVVGFVDNDLSKRGTVFLGLPVFGGFEVLPELVGRDMCFVNLITGSTKIRHETYAAMKEAGCRFTNFIHPSVCLDMVETGQGNYIQENVVLQAGVRIGDNSSVHTSTVVAHESVVGSHVFIAHCCSVSGLVTIGDGAFIGTNATILPRKRIGRWATVGAGAVVIRDVPDFATVVGNPAREIAALAAKGGKGR